VRKRLPELGFYIEKESFCVDAGKNYVAIRACHIRPKQEERPYSEAEYMFGRYLPQKKDSAYIRYLEQEKEKYIGIKNRLAKENSAACHERMQELSHILDLLDETLKTGGKNDGNYTGK
jgi:tRNA (adenine22-N1)-methyltransferase